MKQSPSLFESLEGRQLMAANVAVSGGVLRVDGSDSGDRIVVEAVDRWVSASSPASQVPGASGGGGSVSMPMLLQQYRVKVTDTAGNVRGAPDGTPLDRYFNRQGIMRIDVYAGGGADNVDTSTTSVTNRLLLGSGDDFAQTGSGDDTLWGQAGNDSLYAQAGNDTLYGSDGADCLNGSNGYDQLFGNDGSDTLDGGGNSDWLEAGAAWETALGGGGPYDFNAHEWSVDGTDLSDVKQGRAHTCSLMSTLAAASYQGIDLTTNITYHGNSHYTVRMFDTALNKWVSIGVNFDGALLWNDDNLVVDAKPMTASPDGTKEFWTVLYQRAYLSYFHHKDVTSVSSVMSFEKDPNSAVTVKNVLGVDTSTEGVPWFAEDLQAKLNNGQVVKVFGTGHSYGVLEVMQDSSGAWKVKLFDPRRWEAGRSFAIADSNEDDGMFWVSWSDFTGTFTHYTFSR